MGLRGAVVFLPLCGALFLRGRIPSAFVSCTIVAGPLCVLVGKLILPVSFDPLFLGMLVNVLIMAAGLAAGRARKV